MKDGNYHHFGIENMPNSAYEILNQTSLVYVVVVPRLPRHGPRLEKTGPAVQGFDFLK
jgi:hypothetical protein